MLRMMRQRRLGHRGILLISSYLVLSLFLIYSSAMTLRTNAQQMVSDRLRDRYQAMDLAQGAMEQLRGEFSYFLTVPIYQWGGAGVVGGNGLWSPGDALKALGWLDAIGKTITEGAAAPAPFLIFEDRNHDGTITSADMVNGAIDAIPGNPRAITGLPTIASTTPAAQAPRAWIVNVKKDPNAIPPNDPFAPRLVTMEAMATVGSVTKRIRAVYKVELGASNIFRYAYFLNNYGWFDLQGGSAITINGEVRSNGDLAFTGNTWSMRFHGDLYASQNPELNNPTTGLPSQGQISGDPMQDAAGDYITGMTYIWTRRPIKKMVLAGQPAKGGVPKELPAGYGWDSEYRNPDTGEPDQRRFAAQSTHPMPYLGNLTLYQDLAVQRQGSIDYCCDAQGNYMPTISAVYLGPDGQAGTADDQRPLVLIGTSSHPIYLNGPVVIPGDVLISGYVRGRGTIYAGRNVHILAGVHYWNHPVYVPLERDMTTGHIRSVGDGYHFGTVCHDGSYFTQAETDQGLVPGGCVP